MCNAEYNGLIQGICQKEGEHKQHYFTWESIITEGARKGQVEKYETWWN